MTKLIRMFIYMVIATFLMAGSATAEDNTVRKDIDVSDIAGDWRIEVIGRPDDDFKGSAHVPSGKGNSIMAETITEDKCCGGRNHARVLQNSQITITDGVIKVDSKIVKYLLREEELDLTYSADDFTLTWQDNNTLVGTANGYTPVRWIRDQLEVS